MLVTWNSKDFDCGFIRKHAIRMVDPDEVLATITRLAASKRRPPMKPAELVDALGRAGVNEFASLVRSQVT